MCGLFGFFGTSPNRDLLSQLSLLARSRGPDAYGFAWRTATSSLYCQRWLLTPRAPRPQPFALLPRPCPLIVGHARLGTSGMLSLAETHPLLLATDPPLVFTHNGTVYNAPAFAHDYGLSCQTACDSEVLGRLWNTHARDIPWTMAQLEASQGPTPHAWVAATSTQVWLATWGQPLYISERSEGRYWCSRAFPGSQALVSETFLTWSTVL